MKEYKYKINGTEYKVSVGDIENNVTRILVNGTPYKVELEQTVVPPVKKQNRRQLLARRLAPR